MANVEDNIKGKVKKMAFSLAMIILLGLAANKLFNKLRLPGLLGMLLLGVVLGPYVMNYIDQSILDISADLRKIALIVILLRAGLGIKREALNKVGVAALRLSFIPGVLEGLAIMIFSIIFLRFPPIVAGILGFIIAAVSPAVVVPQMLEFIAEKRGEEKGIPTIILAGVSVDDVVAITIFSAFLGMYGNEHISMATQLLKIPLSIVLGILLGLAVALIFIYLFNRYSIRDTKKALMLIGASIVLTTMEDALMTIIPIASLLGVMTIGFILLERRPKTAEALANKYNKIWVFAELLLFVLVGAQVNIYVAFDAGLLGILIISIGLVFRSIGVILSLFGTALTLKEKLFCVIAYLPKATVQAAIGGIPLAAGVEGGELILALAVLSIVITAPLGAIGIKYAGERILT